MAPLSLKYYLIVIVLAIAAIAAIGYSISLGKPGGYTYITVMEASKHYICSECHREPLIFSKEVMAHSFLPSGVDHKIHIEAAKKMAKKGLQTSSSYPSCSSCHSAFSAEEGFKPGQSLRLCTKCHRASDIAFHEKVMSKPVPCTYCHSDWTGKNLTVKLSFTKTESLCLECHSRGEVGSYKLSELHRLHSKIMDCSSCHKTSVKTHKEFFKSIIATPDKTCAVCHSILGLHGIHYEKAKGITCTSCHENGVGSRSYEHSIEPLKYCLSCHETRRTRFHEKINETMLHDYHCLKCHSEWIDTKPVGYSLLEACRKCHPSSFTIESSYGLHRVHLMKAYIKSCRVCHTATNALTHEEWISSAKNISTCILCHPLDSLEVTHGGYFKFTKNCFASNCHSPIYWRWLPSRSRG
ncbi:MAG: hypothetical protein ABWW69_01260 [Pyrodictiaceae archaeon]